MKTILLCLAALVVSSGSVSAATIKVPAGGDLQAAITAAQPGDVIELPAGATFNGQYRFPAKAAPGVTLRTAGLTITARVSPADASRMATIQSPYAEKALHLPGTTNWTIEGIRFAPNITGAGEVILIQDGLNIRLRGLLFDVPSVSQQKRFVTGNGQGITLEASYCAGVWRAGQDSQCFAAWDGAGPYTITDNYLEAASENVMFGGADSADASRIPSDILVEGNLFTKDLAWKGDGVSQVIKNLFELKNAQRVTIRGNTFEHCWGGEGQSGAGIVFTPRNQNGTNPWTVVSDVLFEKNIVRDVGRGINILGLDDLAVSQQTTRVTIRDNAIQSDWWAFLTLGEIGTLEVYRNTLALPAGVAALYISDEGKVMTPTGTRPVAYAVQSFVWAANTAPSGSGHIQSPVTSSASKNGGELALQTYAQHYSLTVPAPPPPVVTDAQRIADAMALLAPLLSSPDAAVNLKAILLALAGLVK